MNKNYFVSFYTLHHNVFKKLTKGGLKLKKYTLKEVLKLVGYKSVEIEDMSDIEAHTIAVENNYRECDCCNLYVHTDDFNGVRDLCDGCI